MTDDQTSSLLKPRLKHLWLHGFIWGIVIVLIGLLIWFFSGKISDLLRFEQGKKGPPVKGRLEQKESAGAQVASLPPPASAPTLQSQLDQVMAGIREANQKKDLAKLLSYYSPNFPRLTTRAQSISKSWEIYNYTKMEFDIKDVKLLNDNNAIARVTWNIETQNITTKKSKNISKTYLTKFVKESGHWRIEARDKVP